MGCHGLTWWLVIKWGYNEVRTSLNVRDEGLQACVLVVY